eukprot:3933730-Rhodomonas_salina.2
MRELGASPSRVWIHVTIGAVALARSKSNPRAGTATTRAPGASGFGAEPSQSRGGETLPAPTTAFSFFGPPPPKKKETKKKKRQSHRLTWRSGRSRGRGDRARR